jgi:hypothetical protein
MLLVRGDDHYIVAKRAPTGAYAISGVPISPELLATPGGRSMVASCLWTARKLVREEYARRMGLN